MSVRRAAAGARGGPVGDSRCRPLGSESDTVPSTLSEPVRGMLCALDRGDQVAMHLKLSTRSWVCQDIG